MKRTIGIGFKLLVVGLYVMAAPVDTATAAVAGTTLERIARAADVIAVAQVEKIEVISAIDGISGQRVAVAKVLRSLKKAEAGQKLAFLAQPTWTCDISTAAAGETVLLFLSTANEKYLQESIHKYEDFKAGLKQRLPGVPFFQITHHGGGRINVLQQNKMDCLVVGAVRESGNPDVRISAGYIDAWPASLPILAHPDAKETHLRLVPLAEVESAIIAILQTGETPKPSPNASTKKE